MHVPRSDPQRRLTGQLQLAMVCVRIARHGSAFPIRFPFRASELVFREHTSGDIEEAPQRFADDVAGRGLVNGRACFDRGAQLGVETHRYHFCGC